MKRHPAPHRLTWRLLLAAGAVLCAPATWAQVPVDEDGNPIEPIAEGVPAAGARVEAVPAGELMTASELEALVGPIALYPDELLAIVLPASTYPIEIVQAARFLEEQKENENLEPDESWDDSVVALLNYPEVLEMMNEDIDWTWQLGTAVANQQSEVIDAVEAFRDRAYAAGNLKTDEYQTVTENDDGVIEIEPVSEEIIYVPYYEPERVVVYQPRPAYYYYPRPYPVYYYPYPHGYNFYSNYFWGVTTAFTIGWTTNHLHVFHHSYWGHPYYGRTYYPHWWYRRPSITIYNTWYGERRSERTRDHYANGDFWRPRHTGGARPGFNRSRADYYRDRRREASSDGYRERAVANGAGRTGSLARSDDRRSGARPGFRGDNDARSQARDRASADTAIRFREREGRPAAGSSLRERTTDGNERRTTVQTRRAAAERSPPSSERAESRNERVPSRGLSRGDATPRIIERRSRSEQATLRREPVTRAPAQQRSSLRSETRRQGINPAPRASAPARVTPPPSSLRPPTSTGRSVSRPPVSAPRSVSRPAASAPRSAGAASRSPATRSESSFSRRSAPSSSDDRRLRHR